MTLVQKEVKSVYIGSTKVRPPEAKALCFTANTANSTVKLQKTGSPTAVTLETSTDGDNWSTYSFGTSVPLSNIGDKVYFRNTSTTDTGFSIDDSNYYQFIMTGSIAGSGDTTSLLNKNGTMICSDCCFNWLFQGCTSLTTPPVLPATTLGVGCYAIMFNGCTSLTKSPELPATTLTQYCYNNMFNGCTSLVTTPSLPATTLAYRCYMIMFAGCTSLTTLPKLPATTLSEQCYGGMFNGCSKIKLSTSQTGEYQTAYRIPPTGTGSTGTNSFANMFINTGGTFTGTPSINTTYYTSNTLVG